MAIVKRTGAGFEVTPVYVLTFDPTTGAGYPAETGSLAQFNSTLYIKVGGGDTQWSNSLANATVHTQPSLSGDGSVGSPLGVVSSDIRAVLAAQARQFLGDHFQLTIYTFDTTFWEAYINNSNAALAIFTPGYRAPTLDIATGGISTGSVWLRVAGTGIRTDASGLLLSNWSGAAAKGQQVFNPTTTPWYMAAISNFRGETPGNSQKWPISLTGVGTDPASAIGQVGLVYAGGHLNIRAYQGGVGQDNINTGWVDDAKPHLFALGSDTTSMRCLVDGNQVGLSLSSYEYVQTIPSFVNWGAHTGGDSVNYQTNWSLIAIATPTEAL